MLAIAQREGSSRAPWRILFQWKGEPAWLIHRAYRQQGHRLAEIADHLSLHYVTVSRRLKRVEQAQWVIARLLYSALVFLREARFG